MSLGYGSFGKAFYKMKMQYDFNLSRIYELVINSNPCYAFLLDGNTLVQNMLVIAHVYAHSDFFKNNARFYHTSRDMLESMSVNARRIREYEFKYGLKEVEFFLDAVLALQEHVDSHGFIKKPAIKSQKLSKTKNVESPYQDLWDLDHAEKKVEIQKEPVKKFPSEPEKDLLQFLIDHAPKLEPWQRDVISIIRQEMLYFWPQLETKIMNEGWATYWHLRIMRELDLPEDQSIEFAKLHAGILHTSKFNINPYLVGLKIFESIEKRWDNPSAEERGKYGRQGGRGREKIFEVREMESDISFIRNYLTEELVEELDLYLYEKVGNQWVVVEKDWEKVREGLVGQMVNGGFPVIMVEDGDYLNAGELYLRHHFEGRELDVRYLEKTLPYVYLLWSRPVHLETILDGKEVVFSYDGKKCRRRLVAS